MTRTATFGRAYGARARLAPAIERTALLTGMSRRLAWVTFAAAATAGLVAIGVAVWANALTVALGAAIAAISVLASFRWPLLPLFAVAFFTPIEELVVLGPFGSLSRYGEILFLLVYALPRIPKLRFSAMPLAAWGFLVWATMSVAWALDRSTAVQELPVLGLLFATAVAVAALVVERPGIVRPLLWTYSASAFAVAALGLLQFLASGVVTGPNDRAAAFQDQNPAYYAAILLPAFIFCINELLNGRNALVSSAISAVTAGAILASGTRAAWLGAALAVAFFILPRLTRGRQLIAVALLGALGLGVLQFSGLTTLILDRAALAVSTGGAGRTDIWTVGLTIYESAPVTGVGISNFPVAYTPERVRDSDVGAYSADNPAYRAPHNIAIQTMAELGPIGIALLASFLLPLVFRRGWGPEGAVIQATVVSLVTTAFFLDIVNRKQFWLIVAIACGLALLRREQARAERLVLPLVKPTEL